jgi:hypothetical protein
MPGTPGARTGLASILTGDPATAYRTTINAIRDWLEANASLSSAGLLSARPTSTPGTPGIPGRKFYATDTGVEYRDTGTGWVVTGGHEVVTTLPGAPFNGQEVLYLADAAGAYGGPYAWLCRYRATNPDGSANTAASKWDVIDDAHPLDRRVDTSETTGGTGYTDLATVGPAITLPVVGDWDVTLETYISPGTAGLRGYMSVQVGATAAVDTDAAIVLTGEATVTKTRRPNRLKGPPWTPSNSRPSPPPRSRPRCAPRPRRSSTRWTCWRRRPTRSPSTSRTSLWSWRGATTTPACLSPTAPTSGGSRSRG